MRRFAELFSQLDSTTRTTAKVAALEAYFREAPPRDAAWAMSVLLGRPLIRAISRNRLRDWAVEASGYPAWLLAECYEAAGDLSETLALVVPNRVGAPSEEPLHRVIEQRILPLQRLDERGQREAILDAWATFDAAQRFLFHKLISQAFRVGVSAQLVRRALAQSAGIDPAVMAHRLTRAWRATAEDYAALIAPGVDRVDPAQPYPFYLASPLEGEPAELGDIRDWHIEWKWDGIRAQIIHRLGAALAWSRGDELLSDSFPEAVDVASCLPAGTVIDGEILAWEEGKPLPFAMLQRRIGRKRVEPTLFADLEIVVMAYDLLEAGGADVREQPLRDRRARLADIVEETQRRCPGLPLRLSPAVEVASWDEMATRLAESRDRGVEGLMLKRCASPYRVGRVRGDWWKLKIDPHSIDAVLITAQQGSGRRAGLFTDYTFGLWRGGELVPVAKAYSGLTQDEIAEVDRFVREHTTGRFGPVRKVEPQLVFELAFEVVQPSTRHKSGVAVRFPRIARWRRDKKPADADRLETLLKLLPEELRSNR